MTQRRPTSDQMDKFDMEITSRIGNGPNGGV